jgi:hypothetical protein
MEELELPVAGIMLPNGEARLSFLITEYLIL